MDSPACEEEAEYVSELPSLNSAGCSEELELEKIALLHLLLKLELEWPLSRLRRLVRGDSPNVYAIVVCCSVV